jgi:hypothetical protein
MSARRLMGWVVIVAAIAVFAYVGLEAVLILRGQLEAGPFRLATLALNVVTAIALLFLARITLVPSRPEHRRDGPRTDLRLARSRARPESCKRRRARSRHV